MFLLEESSIDLTFKSLHLVGQMTVVFFSSSTFIDEFDIQLSGLISELIESVRVFAITGTDFVLKIS